MADETVSVGLTADSRSFIESFNKGAEAVKNLHSAGQSLASGFRKAGAMIQGTADAIAASMKKAAYVGAAAIGGIGFAVHRSLANFKEFETAMANVSTVMDLSVVSLGTMSDAVMRMTSDFPQSAEELASGLYEVYSAGFKGAAAMEVLEATAKLSTAGLMDMQTAVRGTVSIMNAYNLGANSAAAVTDVIFKAVEVGQMTADEFTQNIGDWASAASSLGIPFESAAAAMATMTTKGALPAMQAATSLSAIFRALIKPSDEMAKTIKRQGFESGKAMLQNLGLAKTLGTLWEASGKTESGFAQLFQESEGFKGALGLVNSGYEMLNETQAEFNSRAATAGTVSEAFTKQMGTLANKSKLLGNELRQMGYEMGKVIAPLAEVFVVAGTSMLHMVNSLPEPLRSVVAVLQLMAPALVVAGGLLAAMALKTLVWTKTMAQIGKLSFVNASMAAWIGKVGAAGGPIKFLRLEVIKFAAADAAMRSSMMRTVTTAGLYAAGFAVAVVAISSLIGAISNAKQHAAELKASFITPDAGQINTFKDLATAYDDAVRANNEAYDKSGGNSFLNDVLASLQMISPFTENTKINAKMASDAMADLAGEYQTLAQAAVYFSDMTGLSTDQVLQGLNQMAADGTVSISTLIVEYEKWMELVRNPDVTAFEQAKALVNETARALGVEPPKVDPKDYMDPKTAGEWERLNGIFGNTQAELEKVAEKQAVVKVAMESASASAQDYALAMIALADSASTANDKLTAFSTIIGQLLGNTVDMRDSQSAFIQSIEKAGQAMVDNGANFDITTAKGQALQESISAASKATAALAEETVRQSGNTNDAIPIISSYVQGMVGVAQQAGWSEDSIAQMIAVMGMTPETIQSIISLPGIDPEMAKLLTLAGQLGGLNGYVAQAGVNVTVRVGMVQDTGIGQTSRAYANSPAGAQAGLGQTPAQAAQAAVDNLLKGIMSNIPKTAAKGGGGGGGGGGAAKWKPTREQLKNMQAALAAPVLEMLTGDLGATWQKQMADQWFEATTKNMLSTGKTRLGAGILKEAQASGTDPDEQFARAAQDYARLTKLVGAANADVVLGMTDNLDAFSKYVDAVEEMIKHQQDVEDWKAERGEIDLAAYKVLLEARLATLEAYTDDWMSVQDQIKTVEEDMKEKAKEALDEEKRLQEARLALSEISKADYLVYLRSRLAALDKYSDEYMSIWREIQDLEKQIIDDTKNSTDSIKSFADDVKRAFDDIKKSVEDPMIRATSLIAAFGDQATVTQEQIQGFYSHMLEGTQRWVTVIKALKEAGVNKSFLNELIQAGPQSLSFAEQVLAMGPGGISMINQSMADIAALAGDLGTNIATGSIGTLNQNDQSVTIQVGDVSIVGEMPGGVTIEQVQAAITAALSGVAVQVANRQTTGAASGTQPAGTV